MGPGPVDGGVGPAVINVRPLHVGVAVGDQGPLNEAGPARGVGHDEASAGADHLDVADPAGRVADDGPAGGADLADGTRGSPVDLAAVRCAEHLPLGATAVEGPTRGLAVLSGWFRPAAGSGPLGLRTGGWEGLGAGPEAGIGTAARGARGRVLGLRPPHGCRRHRSRSGDLRPGPISTGDFRATVLGSPRFRSPRFRSGILVAGLRSTRFRSLMFGAMLFGARRFRTRGVEARVVRAPFLRPGRLRPLAFRPLGFRPRRGSLGPCLWRRSGWLHLPVALAFLLLVIGLERQGAHSQKGKDDLGTGQHQACTLGLRNMMPGHRVSFRGGGTASTASSPANSSVRPVIRCEKASLPPSLKDGTGFFTSPREEARAT